MQTARQNVVTRTLSRTFPERRLFLRSDTETRYVRLSAGTQAVAVVGSALVVGWTIVASAVVLMDTVGAGSVRDHTAREQRVYEERLNAMSAERDQALADTQEAKERFSAALDRVSGMQSELLASETRREELERGMEVAYAGLRKAVSDRDEAKAALQDLAGSETGVRLARLDEQQATIDVLAKALESTAAQRDDFASEASEAEAFAEEQILNARLEEDRNDRIFGQLEEALTVSVKPLDEMFEAAGLDPDTLLDSVKRDYSGQGGPLTPITFSTKGAPPDATSRRANTIIDKLDRMNLYRIAAEKTPFALPVKGSFRFTSGFGPRWGRMHKGTDFAGAHGMPIYATADGVVTYAGRMSGYGNIVKIQHEFGLETRYAHMSRTRVAVGQRVTRGDRIGDMGNTGRSTGTHLHYEVRVGGKAVNPMTYIKAAQNAY